MSQVPGVGPCFSCSTVSGMSQPDDREIALLNSSKHFRKGEGLEMVRRLVTATAFAACILVPLMLPMSGAYADETFEPSAILVLPAGNGCNYPPPYPSPAPRKPLQSFEISYVDEATHTYL